MSLAMAWAVGQHLDLYPIDGQFSISWSSMTKDWGQETYKTHLLTVNHQDMQLVNIRLDIEINRVWMANVKTVIHGFLEVS